MSIMLLCTMIVLGQPGGIVTMRDMETPPDEAMVANVASCFYDAVGFLQKAPATPGEYSSLLLEAKEILEGIGIRLGEGDFLALQWSDDSLHVITPSGFLIECSLISEEHDSSEDGSSYFMTYAFSVLDEGLADSVTVELSI